MQKQFADFIEKNQLLKKGDNLLLAVSGGIDSMVMVHLCHLSGISIWHRTLQFSTSGRRFRP